MGLVAQKGLHGGGAGGGGGGDGDGGGGGEASTAPEHSEHPLHPANAAHFSAHGFGFLVQNGLHVAAGGGAGDGKG